jgi:hypothetical protein
MAKAQEITKEKNSQETPDITHLDTSTVGAQEAETMAHEEDLEYSDCSTTARSKRTRRKSSMASSKHHERQPKNPSAGRNPAKTQRQIAKKLLRANTQNLRTKHARRNCDWEHGLRSLPKRRTSGTPRASTEGPLEILTPSTARAMVCTPRYKTGRTSATRQATRP